MNAHDVKPSFSLGYLTVVTGRLFINTFGRRLAEAGLGVTMEQWGILHLLLSQDARTQESLLPLTNYEKSTLSRILEGIERKGLIERRRGSADARRKEVYLTPEGRRIRSEGLEIVFAALTELYEGIDQAELDQCREMLALMQTRLLTMRQGETI